MNYINFIFLCMISVPSLQLMNSEKENYYNKQTISFKDLHKNSKKDIEIPKQGTGQLMRMPTMRERLKMDEELSKITKCLVISKAKDETK